jgi:hypothetical protein
MKFTSLAGKIIGLRVAHISPFQTLLVSKFDVRAQGAVHQIAKVQVGIWDGEAIEALQGNGFFKCELFSVSSASLFSRTHSFHCMV